MCTLWPMDRLLDASEDDGDDACQSVLNEACSDHKTPLGFTDSVIECPSRPWCQCWCRCNNRPSRLVSCLVCGCKVGPGCCLRAGDICHLCTSNPQEVYDSNDELFSLGDRMPPCWGRGRGTHRTVPTFIQNAYNGTPDTQRCAPFDSSHKSTVGTTDKQGNKLAPAYDSIFVNQFVDNQRISTKSGYAQRSEAAGTSTTATSSVSAGCSQTWINKF